MPKANNAENFEIQHFMLKITGSWPEEHSSFLYNIKGLLSYLSSVALGITMMMEAYNDITNFTKLSEILYILVTIVAYFFKHGSFFIQRKIFIRMIKLLKNPVFVSYPYDLDHLMVERIKTSRQLANSYIFILVSCIILMATTPLFDQKPLPFPFPYDLGKYRPLMYLFQIFSLSLCAWINSSLDSLTACLIGLAATHLDILTEKIARVKYRNFCSANEEVQDNPEEMSQMVEENIKQCVDHHLVIIELIESIDKIFSFGILSQFFASAIIICNTLFHSVLVSMASSQFFMLFNYLILILCELFMYCWFGNKIIWKSEKIGEACYMFNWYECGNKAGKYLFIIMERSKRPLMITAFKFSTLSLAAFSSIIRWSYSYFALLMKLYTKQRENV